MQEGEGNAAETRLSETFVSWNRPHKLSASFDLRFDRRTPGGLGWAKNMGMNLFIEGQSGRPYTPVDERGVAVGSPNSGNAPVQFLTDMRIDRVFNSGGRRFTLACRARTSSATGSSTASIR